MKNPWINLPDKAPYVLPDDFDVIKTVRQRLLSNLELDILPCPYTGDPKKASVYFLLLNPGYEPLDSYLHKNHKEYVGKSIQSFAFANDKPFYFLDQEFNMTGAYRWWLSKFNMIISDCGIDKTIDKVMSVQFFPYHSVNFHYLGRIVPSQEYSFQIVRDAIKSKKLIVIMKGKNHWEKAIPELKNYDTIALRNTRQPFITSRNMKNESDYERIVESIKGKK